MRKICFLGLSLLVASLTSHAQEYVRLMEEHDANFYDIQQAFNQYWDGKTQERGKGWKQFKRWEYFMEPRVYPSGKLPNPAIVFDEYNLFKSRYENQKSKQNHKSANWTPLGPTNWNSIGWNPGIGRINAVTVDPNNSSVIYVGTPAGGCWKSTNGGNSWTPLTDDLASLGVSGIAIDPTNSNTVYIATGDGDGTDTYSIGVMKSTDGGATWNSTGLNWSTSQARVMRKIIIDPNNPNILFVASSNGLYKTTNAGGSWISVMGGSIRDVEFNPLNTNTIFACTNTNFYKSTTGGNAGSFANITNGTPASSVGRLAIGVTPHDSNYVYLLASSSSDNGFLGLYRSTDGGNTFSLRSSTPNVFGYNTSGNDAGGQSWYDMALAVSPINKNIVFTGGINVWKSTNGGSSLTALTKWNWPTGSYEYVHADIHTLDFYGTTLFCGSDGGISYSTDHGTNFNDITAGIQNSQFYRLANDPNNSTVIMGGTQDNGCFLYKNSTWTHVTGGDGMECLVDYNNPNNMYSTSQYGNIYKSTNGGASFNNIAGGLSGQGAWVSPYCIDPVNSNTLYMGYHDVWKTTNGGNSWNTISSFASGGDLRSLVVAPSNNNTIYASSDFIIWKTTNGGSSWSNITSNLPGGLVITYIAVHNTNPNMLWVTFSGYTNGEKVYQSTDGGASWTNVSGNLPNMPVNCIAYEYGSNNGVYVGTDMGVYYKNDDMALWQSYMDGLPNVMVNELEIHYPSSKIRAATYGRGIWESDLFTPAPPTAQFYSPDTLICPNACAKFYNTTPFLGLTWQWYFPGGNPSTSTDLNPVVCYASSGTYNVSLIVYNPQGSDSTYESSYVTVTVPSGGSSLPLAEGFETSTSIPSGWVVLNEDQGITWEHNQFAGGYGNSPSSFRIDNFSTHFEGERDYLISPPMDFTGISQAELRFDVAYAQWSVARKDTFSVYYTNDCGVTKNLLYQKTGSALATAPNQPIFFTPTPSQWRTDTVNLDSVAGLNSIQFYFENRSDNGNVLYLDNINIYESFGVGVIEQERRNEPEIYPNPFSNTLHISGVNRDSELVLYNSIGQIVLKQRIQSGETVLELGNQPQGVYFLKLQTGENNFTKTLIKN
ncbi:MAG: T9SS type A sorting domain-containing protein [Flavobacteriales bacterium]|nr:T9SS type A sorting domain-containing protein [Flavobacteriales bacterium]